MINYSPAFAIDTNVLNWLDVSSLQGEVFTTGQNIREFERLVGRGSDYMYLQSALEFFSRNSRNIIDEGHTIYGTSFDYYRHLLRRYRSTLVKKVVYDAAHSGKKLTHAGSLVITAIKMFRLRLRRSHEDLYWNISTEALEEIEELIRRFAINRGRMLLEGKQPEYNPRSLRADRGLISVAYVVPNQTSYVVSQDSDLWQLLLYTQFLDEFLKLEKDVKLVNNPQSMHVPLQVNLKNRETMNNIEEI